MKSLSGLFFLTILSVAAFSQQTSIYTDPQGRFKQAQEYFDHKQFSLALPVLREVKDGLNISDVADRAMLKQDVDFYLDACMLMLNDERAVQPSTEFINLAYNTPRTQQLSFLLAQYYYRRNNFAAALPYYEKAGIANLNNEQIAEAKFQMAYSYFTLQRFDEAKPLFNTIRSMPDDPNYIPANYYYGFLAYEDGNYKEALDGFMVVKDKDEYKSVVPFYITSIYYVTGQKDKALQEGEKILKSGNSFYDTQLRQLVGHAWFEKKEYSKAQAYLEEYVKKSEKVSREDLYELSFCYYQSKQWDKAIDGFKQLSGKEDSLSQSAMYLLGDAYLKTGQKANARNAFSFCAANSSNPDQKEISKFNYAKLSYELGYQDVAISELKGFLNTYPRSAYNNEAKELLVAVLTSTSNYKDALSLMESMGNSSESTKKLYPKILYGRATELINDQQLNQADQLLDKILRDPYNASVLPYTNFWKGEIAYRNNRLDDAVRYYNAYLGSGAAASGEVSPKEAKYNLGYCYLQKENYNQALGYFQQVVKTVYIASSSIDQDTYVRTADCYYMARNYNQALSMYNQVINYSWPASDYATYQKAMITGINDPAGKIDLLKNLERKFPGSDLVTDVNMEIANTYMAKQDFRNAIPFYTNVINSSNEGSKPRAYLSIGIAYYNLDKNNDAVATYKTLINKYPNSEEASEAIENVRTIFVEEGRPNDYVEFARAAGKDVRVSEADSLSYAAAELKYSNGDCNGAIEQFNNYIQRYPSGAFVIQANYFKSECYAQRKDWKNAVTGYEYVAMQGNSQFAERSALLASRIYYFELPDINKAKQFFIILNSLATTEENRLESLRGLLRCNYQLQQYEEASKIAAQLLDKKGISSDDKALANLVMAKDHQLQQQYDLAINAYRQVINANKGAWAAEARYEIANSYFALNSLANAEKSAFEVINKSGSYNFWVTKAYILLGDIYFKQKDYFNAKATFQSVVDNATNLDLKNEAQQKLNSVIEAEKTGSKIENG